MYTLTKEQLDTLIATLEAARTWCGSEDHPGFEHDAGICRHEISKSLRMLRAKKFRKPVDNG